MERLMRRVPSYPGCSVDERRSLADGNASFRSRLRAQLNHLYGSPSRSTPSFQSLLRDLSCYQDFCEFLRFLRIPFRDEEAKTFLETMEVEIGTDSVVDALRECMEETHRRTEPTLRANPVPLRVSFRPKTKAANTRLCSVARSQDMSASGFHSPARSVAFSPLSLSDFCPQERATLYFLRDAVELLLRKHPIAVSSSEFEQSLPAFGSALPKQEAKRLFRLAERPEGGVTKESFRRFWQEIRANRKSSTLTELVKRLQGVYPSFLDAFTDVSQGNTHLSLGCVQTLCKSLCVPEPSALPVASPGLSLQEFKTIWLNSALNRTQNYCGAPPCSAVVSEFGALCQLHSESAELQGKTIWTTVKAGIEPKRLVEAISAIRRHSDLKPDTLREILSKFLPQASVSSKDLSKLTDYFRSRLRSRLSPHIAKRRSCLSLTLAGEETETQDCSFYRKERWTPTMAGMAGVPRSVVSRHEQTGKSLTVQFPYPHRKLPRAKPR